MRAQVRKWAAGTFGTIAFLSGWELLVRFFDRRGWLEASLFRPSERNPYSFESPFWLISTALAFALLLPVLRRVLLGPRAGKRERPKKRGAAIAVLCVALIVANLNFLLVPIRVQMLAEDARSGADLLMLAAAALLTVGMVEEMLFRYLLQDVLAWAGGSWGILLSVLAFALYHGDRLFVGFGFGLAFAALYDFEGRLLPVVLVHGIYDTICYLEMYALWKSPGVRLPLLLSIIGVSIVGAIINRTEITCLLGYWRETAKRLSIAWVPNLSCALVACGAVWLALHGFIALNPQAAKPLSTHVVLAACAVGTMGLLLLRVGESPQDRTADRT